MANLSSIYKAVAFTVIFTTFSQCSFNIPNSDDDQKIIDDYINTTNNHSNEMSSLVNNMSAIKIRNKDDTIFYQITMSFEEPVNLKKIKKDIDTDKEVDLMGKFIFAGTRRNKNFSKAIINKGYCVFNKIHIYPNDVIVKSGFSAEEYSDIYNYAEENREAAINEYIKYWVKEQNKNLPIDDEYTSFKGVKLIDDEFIGKYVVKSNDNYLRLKHSQEEFKQDIITSLKEPTAAIDFRDILNECPQYSIKFVYYNPSKTSSFSFNIHSFEIN